MPSSTISNSLYWVYVLLSLKDRQKYVGYAKDINRRLKEHAGGYVLSTQYRRPLQLIYLEACLDVEDAKRREGYLKTSGGRMFLAKRLKEYFLKQVL